MMSGDTCILNSHDILLYISNYRSDVSILFIYEDFPMVYNNNENPGDISEQVSFCVFC